MNFTQKNQYKYYRKFRGDGNSLFRATFFAYLEYILNFNNQEMYNIIRRYRDEEEKR